MSPTATKSADEARRAVLRAADEFFYAHGIGGVVMSDIRDASGVSMRRLYAMYPSKSELVAALRVIPTTHGWPGSRPASNATPPPAPIRCSPRSPPLPNG